MRENGYSRSQRLRDMLRADHDPFAPLVDPPPPLGRAESSALRKGDLAEWVHLEDPAAIRSFSSLAHPCPPKSPPGAITREVGAVVGPKERTGAVRDDGEIRKPAGAAVGTVLRTEDSPSRFISESAVRIQTSFKTPPGQGMVADPTLKTDEGGSVAKSGFTRGNAYEYYVNPQTDEEMLLSLHPTLARFYWKRDRGLFAAKPCKTHTACRLE
ncbi:hypothetical protein HK405_000312 [Cladochytrium tenue]|nr:hypothetical protein HK405_000312 [Cladochytrium tenue]